MKLSILVIVLPALLLMTSCGPPPRVAVEERSTITVRQQTEKIGGNVVRLVEPGDTLYSIAFAAGLNVNDIVAWNSISDTSKVQVGQKIRLTKPLNFIPPKPVATASRSSSSRVRSTSPKAVPIDPQDSTQTINRAVKPITPSVVRWYWPTEGRVIARFASANGQQGIDIEGNLGQSVVSASDGEVVYVGNGLKGYGNLIIIKHNTQYLSAYAHNREYFVREGERVKAKQVIGSLGKNNRQKNALHFQIRKDGKPVDPQRYLAKR